MKSRMFGWKSRNLSLGGCLVLMKYVLSFLPNYFLSFFKAPTSIIFSVEFIFKCFFKGDEDTRKILRVKWDIVRLDKEKCGLGDSKVEGI